MGRQVPPARGMRIVVVEDHAMFAQAMELSLRAAGHDVRQELVGDEGCNVARIFAAVVRHRPHVVLLDLDLGSFGDGQGLIAPLTLSGIAVVVVTASVHQDRWGEALAHGAQTVLTKDQPLQVIRATIQRLGEGLPVIEPDDRDALVQLWQAAGGGGVQRKERLNQLTPREMEILAHLMRGRTVAEISRRDVVSQSTVRSQIKAVLGKLGVSSQLAAVVLAHDAGLRAS